MKKTLSSLTIIFCLSALAWAQGSRTELFDVKKSQEELEIMKGILATTISFVAQNLQTSPAKETTTTSGQAAAAPRPNVVTTPFGQVTTSIRTFRLSSSSINAFYLYGQGAVFVIPASNLRLGNYGSAYLDLTRSYELMDLQEKALAKASQALGSGVGQGTGSGTGQGVVGGIAGGVVGGVPPPPPPPPPKPATAPQAPTPPAPKAASQEDLQKQLQQLQEKARKSREEQEQQRAQMTETLGKIKTYLIEALANYGDSLTTIKPNEYITLVIMTDDSGSLFGSDRASSHCEMVSAQKSWITDYKAGKLTLDAFKQKVLQYSE
jgi:hypothetical protein